MTSRTATASMSATATPIRSRSRRAVASHRASSRVRKARAVQAAWVVRAKRVVLAVATLHANSANQALDRIINFFPEERRQQLLMDLSLNLKGLVSQRLVPRKGAPGRAVAIEILLNTPLISDLIF